jgi:hypothetical protein
MDNHAMLILSDSENESDHEETPDLDKNIFIEPNIVESSDNSDEEESTVLLSREPTVRVFKSVECPMEAEYNANGSRKENADGCCI